MEHSATDTAGIWRRVLADLDASALPASQRAFLRMGTLIGMLDNTALIAVPDSMTKDIVEQRVRTQLLDSLSRHVGMDVRLAVTVDPSLRSEGSPTEESRASGGTPSADPVLTSENGRVRSASAATSGAQATTQDRSMTEGGEPTNVVRLDALRAEQSPPGAAIQDELAFSTRRVAQGNDHAAQSRREADYRQLNPKYTFDTFVIGASNRFAHAAAVAVAEAPAKAYNPLFIYGDSGLGKTHLLHAIGHYARQMFPNVRVKYVNSEEFTNDFINSIRDDKAAGFQRRYREVDVLLIDDIQFLQGKMQTQEEFFHTFNTLHNSNKQVVITSDVPPKALQGFEERMRSRFEWGLLTDIQPPDLETRIAILRKKAIAEDMETPDDVMEFIASRISSNIRELEGALIRVTAFANLQREPVDHALAAHVLKDIIPDSEATQITAGLIIGQTAQYYGLGVDDLCGTSRSRVLVNARQIAMYLCRELTDLSLPKIGAEFGGRDHTTVMHADRKIRAQMGEKRSVYNQVMELTARVRAHQATG